MAPRRRGGRGPARDARRGNSRGVPQNASRRVPAHGQAAEVSRAEIRTRRERIIATARPILQTSVAASLAWRSPPRSSGTLDALLRSDLRRVTLGLTSSDGDAPLRLAIGVSVGIAIADLLVPGSARARGRWASSPASRCSPRPSSAAAPCSRRTGGRLGRAGGHAPAARVRLRRSSTPLWEAARRSSSARSSCPWTRCGWCARRSGPWWTGSWRCCCESRTRSSSATPPRPTPH